MILICWSCGRDIDAIGQDNMSAEPGRPLCEDCVTDAFADRLADALFGQERHR